VHAGGTEGKREQPADTGPGRERSRARTLRQRGPHRAPVRTPSANCGPIGSRSERPGEGTPC
jgi:hypothetical protein